LNFRQLLAKYVTGNLPPDNLPKLAVTAMEEGIDSPSLHILAGLEKAEDSLTFERYFFLALKELAIQLPDKRQAALIYALAIAEEIISGKKELIAGIAEIDDSRVAEH
jgi:hypothetical protein